jgi:membrane fusion protein (multidrug efflux system)
MGELKHAFLVPQAAVQRDANSAFVLVVGGDGKVVQKNVKADAIQGDDWIVTDGIADGDQIVVSGIQKAKAGAPAKATPWQPDQPASGPSQQNGAPPKGQAPATGQTPSAKTTDAQQH